MIVPKLRFSEFKDDWSKKKLGEVAEFLQGEQVDLELQKPNHATGLVKFLRIENFTQLSSDFRYVQYNGNFEKILKTDDIAIVRYGATAGFICSGIEGLIANNIFKVIVNECLNKKFTLIQLKSDKVFNYLQSEMSGGAMPALNFKIAGNIDISFPEIEEQAKIAEFLSAVDDKISQLSRQLELLSQYKKGVMQKIFSQEIRFKNENGEDFEEWENSFIGNECKITTGNKDTQNKIDDGIYPFFVRSQTVERINSYSMDCEAILTSGDGVGVGKNYHYINGKFDFHQRVYCLYDFSERLNGKYLFIYFSQFFFDRVKRLSAKNSVDSVRMDMISKMEIKLPSTPEQEKIAEFLTAIDERIDHTTAQLTHTKQWKKGLLQQMFV
ncbi:restriction endonuclease subunit S [Moraxella sp. PS-22]|jgi:type I restriction enzyme S subunit|uniref:Restriction endonuclease subunit S n=1 Tax=Moraxella tetraodonis TaxID=2767221 RepID=A0A9X1UT38_9GAMM|nr:restriction endonuclease subunit S [Moraxella tetraodonis]MCG8148618.1 restriction endonuclease subunit S [Moraxella tetraodonis]